MSSDSRIKLFAADGTLLQSINPQRLSHLQKLGLIRRTVATKAGKPLQAWLWIRNGESVFDRLPIRPYSFQERLEIHRVWTLMRISEKDRPVFQTSITDNLVYVDPATGAKRQAA